MIARRALVPLLVLLLATVLLPGSTNAQSSSGCRQGSSACQDSTPPVFDKISIASNGPNPSVAYAGDTVTLTMVANEPIVAPVVRVNGRLASSTSAKQKSGSGSGGDTEWTASVVMGSAEAVGPISFSATAKDIAGNAGAAATALTTGSNVSFTDYAAPAPLYCLWSHQFSVSPKTYQGHSYILDPYCEPTAIVSLFTAKTISTSYTITTKSNDRLYIDKNCGFLGFSCTYRLKAQYITATSTSGTLPPYLTPGDALTLEWKCQPFQSLLWKSKSTSFFGLTGDSDIENKNFIFSTRSVGIGFDTGGTLSGSTTVYPEDTTTYGFSCGGIAYVIPEIEIFVDNPKGIINASPNTVAPEGKVTLNWSARNVKKNSCKVTGPSASAVVSSQTNASPAGGVLSGPVTGDESPVFFTLTCERYTGASISWKSNPVDIANKCLTARDPARPESCAFSASPSSVLQGGLSTLSWYCPLPSVSYSIEKKTASSSPWSVVIGGSIPASRTGTNAQHPLLHTTYRLSCKNGTGIPGVGFADVAVRQPVLSLTTTADEIPPGGSTKITWNTQNINAGSSKFQTLGGPVLSALPFNLSGFSVSPSTLPTTYTLTGATPASVAGTAPAPRTQITIYENGKGPRVLTFFGNPSSVRKGASTKLFWTGTILPPSCALSSNPALPGLPSTISSTPTGNSTGVDTGPITQKVEFTINCTSTARGKTTVTVIPIYQEI